MKREKEKEKEKEEEEEVEDVSVLLFCVEQPCMIGSPYSA